MTTFAVERLVRVPPPVLFRVLADFTRPPAPGLTVEVEREGDPQRQGAGTVRTVVVDGRRFREELLEAVPPRFIRYRILEGAPVRDYVGTIELIPRSLGTQVLWSVTFRPRFPWPGWLLKLVARRTARRILRRVAESVEGRRR